MKILIIAAHEVLESDEVNMLTELGHEVCSTGFFLDPENPKTILRGKTKNKKNSDFIEAFTKENPNYILPCMHPHAGFCDISLELANKFDIIILQHYHVWLDINWETISKMKPTLIIRSLGFGVPMVEHYYNLIRHHVPQTKIVRLSERERMCYNYCGEDIVIPQCYNPNDYLEWNGTKENVLTINKMFKARAEGCGYEKYLQVTEPFKEQRILCGNGNEDIPFSKHATFDELKRYLADSRCYLSTMSKPASCVTYAFIEALCQGIPIVSFGNQTGNSGGETFGIDKYIQNEVNGFYSDDNVELQGYIRELLTDHNLAKQIGQKGKEKGLALFHWDVCKDKWRQILETV